MFVCKKVCAKCKKKVRVGCFFFVVVVVPLLFFFFCLCVCVCVCVCVKAAFFQIEKNIQVFIFHAFHIFMFTHVFHVPQVLRKKTTNKQNTALVQKIMGLIGR